MEFRKSILAAATVLSLAALGGCGEGGHKKPETTKFGFANVEEGRNILTAPDGYMTLMSRAEIAIRLEESDPAQADAAHLRARYRSGVESWTAEEKAKLVGIIASHTDQLAGIAHLLPEKVLFVKVSNLVEGGLPHTRANAIIFPDGSLQSESGALAALFFHELFHVLSRAQEARHDSLYGIVGFKPCDVRLPEDLRARRLTNPDAPLNSHYVPLDEPGKGVVPFLYAKRDAYDPGLEGGFPAHFGMKLAMVDIRDGQCAAHLGNNGEPELAAPQDVPAYGRAIGRNTAYIIHPEEVMADNFSFLMLRKPDLPNPEIGRKLAAWLQE